MLKFCKEKWEENEEKFRQYVADTLAEDVFVTKINYASHFDNALLKYQEELEKTGNSDKIVELARQLIANLEPVYNTERWYRKK